MTDASRSLAHLDATALRVLAHPLRARLLTRLRRHGPATATTLAQVLETNTGATSYHLRKLAGVGLVEETDDGVGRERWWRAAHEAHSWSPTAFEQDPDARAASEWLEGEYLRYFVEQVGSWQSRREAWPREWRDAAGASDWQLRLTPESLTDLKREIEEVVERYRQLSEPETAGDAAAGDVARQVLLYVHGVPDPTAEPPRAPGEGGAA